MKTLLTTSLLALSLTTTANAKSIPAGVYNLDPSHSKIGFEIPHLVISTVEGRFAKFEGQFTVDEKLEKSKVDLSIDSASINTENKDRDDHLRSADFFDVAKYPKLTFVTKKIQGSADNLKVTGDLTIKGKKKQIVLEGKYLGDVNDAYGNSKIAFTAKGVINRKDFGLTWSNMVEAGPVVGDEVTLIIKVQAAKPLKK